MKPQTYISKHSVRIKFSSKDERGHLHFDSYLHEEYADMQSHPPKGWMISTNNQCSPREIAYPIGGKAFISQGKSVVRFCCGRIKRAGSNGLADPANFRKRFY